jgi:Fe-coproporphyrin III synthase
MFLIIKYLLHSVTYSFKTKVLRQNVPFIAGMVLNNDCNLSCLQCSLLTAERTSLTYQQISKGLDELYLKGIRSVAITGGEPFMWKNGNYKLNDVIRLMYEKKILVTSVYTNGTFPISTIADNVFVSIDGMEATTKKLRGPIFNEVIGNIKASKHPKIFINYTINKKNCDEIEQFCQYVETISNIKGIFFYFYTPYEKSDDLFLTREEEIKISYRLISLKKKYKILNSTAALEDFITNNWQRPSDVCIVFSDKAEIVKCCRSVDNNEACENCGYLGYLEVIDIIKFKLSAVLEAFHYLPNKSSRESYVG